MKWYLILGCVILFLPLSIWLIAPYFINTAVNDVLEPEHSLLINALQESSTHVSETEDKPTSSTNSDPLSQNTQRDEPASVVGGPFLIKDTPGHRASGAVFTIISPEQQIVRFEDYTGTNGPDLFVYLAKDLEASEFINLGRAKGNSGDISYEVPAGVDISEYKYVLTWCRLFGVLFDYAELSAE